jgi:hypothetical protein
MTLYSGGLGDPRMQMLWNRNLSESETIGSCREIAGRLPVQPPRCRADLVAVCIGRGSAGTSPRDQRAAWPGLSMPGERLESLMWRRLVLAAALVVSVPVSIVVAAVPFQAAEKQQALVCAFSFITRTWCRGSTKGLLTWLRPAACSGRCWNRRTDPRQPGPGQWRRQPVDRCAAARQRHQAA